jgi:TolB-like protein/tetratricopeptide (TPR) repeat protein
MTSSQVHFGRFQLDLARHELSRDGTPLQIGSRALDILCALAMAKGDVVTKDQLMVQVWPGVTVEESNIHVHVSALRKALDKESQDGPSHVVTVPGRGYRLIGLEAPAQSDTRPAARASLAIPDKPSIAVLPFTNLGDDPQQDYFADGIVEEVTTALARMSWLFVIARNSSFTFKDRPVDVKEVGRELGVRYVLEGSVRKAGARVRVMGRLVDAGTGAHLWADRFEGDIQDIFDLQDRVTTSVVGAIAPKLERAEIDRAMRRPTANLDAYDYYLRGLAGFYRWSREGNDEALKLFSNAVKLDPNFSTAYGMAAWCYGLRRWNGWMLDHDQETIETARLAERAVELGMDDAVALYTGGFALAHVVGDLRRGAALIDRSLILNTNLAAAWNASGWVRTFLSETDLAIDHLAQAMRLSPLDPLMYLMQSATALAHFVASRYAEASSWAQKAFGEQPNSLATLRILAASTALSGQLDEARKAIARARHLDPNSRISNLKHRVGRFGPDDYARYADALRLAGLPE